METADSPSASATATAAVTIRSSVSPGLGPRLGRSPPPHSSSRLRAVSPLPVAVPSVAAVVPSFAMRSA